MRTVTILGSTGSIGTQAIDVVGRHKDKFTIVGLSANGGRVDRLADQIAQTGVRQVGVSTPEAAERLRSTLAERGISGVDISVGPQASSELARKGADVVLNAITGYAGLEPTLAALESGSTLALANKESLVVGGELVMGAAVPGQIIPVDSEHSAFAQCLRSGRASEVSRLILTASGGPFRGRTRAELEHVTVEQAMAHPTWAMGRVVTINSATLVNKGLELIEASRLFGVPCERIQVTVHPQSMVHSMVEFCDGSTIAQCSPPDMRLPIALALSWPDRLSAVGRPLDWTTQKSWTFEPVDEDTFPAVGIARDVGSAGGTVPTVMNAANEVCVDAFCEGRLGFLGIVDTVARVVDEHLTANNGPGCASDETVWAGASATHGTDAASLPDATLTLGAIRRADAWSRARTLELIGG